MFSPRMWGCTAVLGAWRCPDWVFPTHVGVYRDVLELTQFNQKFSPRMWGCTFQLRALLSKVVGFPHACGGVPSQAHHAVIVHSFSPRMWGCTSSQLDIEQMFYVFPTHVGVYHILI